MSNVGSALDLYRRGKEVSSSDFLGDVPSGYGAEYDQLFANNPYRNLSYKNTGFQRLLSTLGFRTDYDRWLEDAQVNAREYDAGIFSMMQQNAYNSPEAQADRMRMAGQNPDLLGTGDVQEASQAPEDPNGMSSNSGNEEFLNFGETIASVFSRAMAVFKDFKSLEQMNTIIDSQNIDNAVKMTGAIDSFIESSLTAEDMVDYETYQDRMRDLISNGYDDQFAEHMGFSKRQRPQFKRLVHDKLLSMSADEKAYNMLKNRIDAMSGSKESQTNPFAFGVRGTFEPTNETAVDVMVKGLSKAHKRALQYIAKRDASRASVEMQEAQSLDMMNAGRASAQTQMAEYSSKKAVAQWNAECARIKKDMIQQLERLALGGDWLSKAMLFSWSLDDIARLSVGLNGNVSASFGADFSLDSVLDKFVPDAVKKVLP